MKIGILTFHRALNYGAVLQCFALQEKLHEMGHDIEIIDYRPTYIERERWAFNRRTFQKKTWKGRIKYILLIPFKLFFKRKASQSFDSFTKRRFHFSQRVKSASDIPSYYDVIVFGSDQIWNPSLCDGLDPIFYGQIAKGKARFISYAASLEGYQRLLPNEWTLIADRMNNFDALSVRELSFKKELTKYTNKPIECVVDPTLLASPQLFEKIAIRPPYQRYVFLFTVQSGDLPYHIAKKIAEERGLIIVRARASGRLNIQNRETGVKSINAISPELFVGLISYAECVVTNSFHATAISIQLGKDFYTAECLHPNRIIDLLNMLGLSNRYITRIDNLKKNISPINYDVIHAQINHVASKSDEYLTKNL